MNDEAPEYPRPWLPVPPGRLLGRGHPAGDFLEAYDWNVLHQTPGNFTIEAHLPAHVKNPRGQLFGGFTPTYIDLLAVRTVHSLTPNGLRGVLTLSMHIDYLEPVQDARFRLVSRIVHSRAKTHLVEVLLKNLGDKLLVFSTATLRERT